MHVTYPFHQHKLKLDYDERREEEEEETCDLSESFNKCNAKIGNYVKKCVKFMAIFEIIVKKQQIIC